MIKVKPIDVESFDDALTEKFRLKHAVSDGCWEWQALKTPTGYGRFCIGSKWYLAHRVAYAIHNRVDPDVLLVCHKCDNPACVNPDHLFLGEHVDNIRDMMSKGREGFVTKLTEEQVEEIRRLVVTEDMYIADVASQFGVSYSLVQKLINNKFRLTETRKDVNLRRAPRGERCHASKLTANDVMQIRKDRESGVGLAELASRYGVAAATISQIALRKKWKHI